jgi:ferric iron reductase protein FhuF
VREAKAVSRRDSPLRETLGRIDPERYYFALTLGSPEDPYETVGSLTRNRGQSLARRMELVRTKWGLSVRDSALHAVGAYAWGVGGPAIACYVLSRRVPDVSPANVALSFDGNGGLSEVALLRPWFAVLPQDPAADHPEAVVVESAGAMLGWMRDRLVAGMEPLIDAVRHHARLGRRTAWSGTSDYVADAFLMVAWDTEDQARYAADAEVFVGDPDSSLKGNTKFFVVEERGRRGAYVTRGICCQAYKDPEHDNCDSCPMLLQEERERRALADLASRR